MDTERSGSSHAVGVPTSDAPSRKPRVPLHQYVERRLQAVTSHYCPFFGHIVNQGQCFEKTVIPEINRQFCRAQQCKAPWRVCPKCLEEGEIFLQSIVVDPRLGLCLRHQVQQEAAEHDRLLAETGRSAEGNVQNSNEREPTVRPEQCKHEIAKESCSFCRTPPRPTAPIVQVQDPSSAVGRDAEAFRRFRLSRRRGAPADLPRPPDPPKLVRPPQPDVPADPEPPQARRRDIPKRGEDPMVTRAVKAANGSDGRQRPSRDEQEKITLDVGREFDRLEKEGMSSGDAVRKIMKDRGRSNPWVYTMLVRYRRITGAEKTPAKKGARQAQRKPTRTDELQSKRARATASNGTQGILERIAEATKLRREADEIMAGVVRERAAIDKMIAEAETPSGDGLVLRGRAKKQKR